MSSPAICADAGGAAGATSEPGSSQEPPQEPPHLAETDQGIEKVMLACQEEGCIKTFQSLAALKKHLDVGKHMVRLAESTYDDNQRHQLDKWNRDGTRTGANGREIIGGNNRSQWTRNNSSIVLYLNMVKIHQEFKNYK